MKHYRPFVAYFRDRSGLTYFRAYKTKQSMVNAVKRTSNAVFLKAIDYLTLEIIKDI